MSRPSQLEDPGHVLTNCGNFRYVMLKHLYTTVKLMMKTTPSPTKPKHSPN
jgi:hypothetical protein